MSPAAVSDDTNNLSIRLKEGCSVKQKKDEAQWKRGLACISLSAILFVSLLGAQGVQSVPEWSQGSVI